MVAVSRKQKRQKRQFRARKRLIGTQDRPRLAVFRSNKHITAQVIVDADPATENKGSITLCGVGSNSKDLKTEVTVGTNVKAAEAVGTKIAELAKAKGVTKVVFDKGGNIYHGRVQALADAAREAGLDF